MTDRKASKIMCPSFNILLSDIVASWKINIDKIEEICKYYFNKH